jgi:hypothetical protein
MPPRERSGASSPQKHMRRHGLSLPCPSTCRGGCVRGDGGDGRSRCELSTTCSTAPVEPERSERPQGRTRTRHGAESVHRSRHPSHTVRTRYAAAARVLSHIIGTVG